MQSKPNLLKTLGTNYFKITHWWWSWLSVDSVLFHLYFMRNRYVCVIGDKIYGKTYILYSYCSGFCIALFSVTFYRILGTHASDLLIYVTFYRLLAFTLAFLQSSYLHAQCLHHCIHIPISSRFLLQYSTRALHYTICNTVHI